MKRIIVEKGKRHVVFKKTFGSLFKECSLVRMCGVHDALGAYMVERFGFESLWLSSFEMHASARLPDADILTVKDYADAINKIADRTNLPIMVDGDCGGGSPINTIRMVREYEKAGASGICIEDNLYPKRCSFYSGVKRTLESPSIHAEKIRAACENRLSGTFFVVARVEALVAGHSVCDAVMRAHRYADAGADAVVIHCKDNTPARVIEFWNKYHATPVICIPTMYPTVKETELKKHGISGVIYANAGLRSYIWALNRVWNEISGSGTLEHIEPYVASMEDVYSLVGVNDLRDNERRYTAKV